jgi:tetratricopeptide (TPR) repeat protein
VKKSFHSLKRIAGWTLFFSIVTFLATYMLGMLFDSDGLKNGSWFVLLVAIPAFVILISLLFIRWLFSWRNLKRALMALGCLTILAALFYCEEDYRGWHAWQSFKQQEEAKGERFDFASVVPPPVPDDQNFALTPIVASCYEGGLTKEGKVVKPFNTNVVDRLAISAYDSATWPFDPTNGYWARGTFTDLSAWQKYYRTPSTNDGVPTNEFPISPQPQSPAADVLLALSKFDSTIEELRQAGQLPYSRFPLNYTADHPFDVRLIHLAAIKRCVQILQLRAEAELELGQSDKALDDVKLSFRLIDSIRTEPFLISHLVRIANLQIILQPVWQGTMKHQWSDAQLAEIEQELGKLDFLKDCQFSMRGERNSCLLMVDNMRSRRSYEDFRGLFYHTQTDDNTNWQWKEFSKAVIYHLVPDGWFYQNEVEMGKVYQQIYLPMTDPAKRLAFPQMDQSNEMFFASMKLRPRNYFVRMFLPAIEAAERKFAYAQESADLAQVGCALERYRLAHNEYPETLDALAPQFISQIPHDIIGGQPLHYRRTDGGKYLLYSVGWNETDDNGVVELRPNSTSVDITKGDWVWSGAEINQTNEMSHP